MKRTTEIIPRLSRSLKPVKTYGRFLTDDEHRLIKALAKLGYSLRFIGWLFGIHNTSVGNIVNGKTRSRYYHLRH